MQFGIFDIMQVPAGTPSETAFAEHLADVEMADDLGLDYYFAAERHFMPLYRTPSPSVWLAAVAARTRRIRVGALAYVLPLHNPVRLAEEVAMLDHLSGGRMEVGVGLGHRPEELVSLGVNPDNRQPLLMEGVVLMARAWRGEPFDHPGEAYQFRNLYVQPPVQRPHPPLWYAGNNPPAAGWAARNGLSLAVGFQGDEQLVAPSEAFRAARQASGREPAPRLALMRHLYVADSDEQAMEEMTRDMMAIGDLLAASPRQAASLSPRTLGQAEARQAVERLLEQQVIVAGGVETCARALAETAARLGLDVFLANPYLTSVEQTRVQRTIRLYATEVAPRVSALVTDLRDAST